MTHDGTADRPVRWGILATGKIARKFAADLALVPDAELVAVGSRSAGSAESFAAEHGAPGCRAHASYEALVADPDVDVVYVASPHALHLEHARLAFEAGKHVLCEKPLAVTAADAEAIVALARRHDRFLMEAMWTACHPVVRAVAAGLRERRFGTPRQWHAELGFVVDTDALAPDDRLLDPALGAGAMLDMGIYPLTTAHLLFGEAEVLTAAAAVSASGIDLDIAVAGRYPGGVVATMSASMTSWSSRTGTIATDRGRIDLADFHHPTRATFTPLAEGGDDGTELGVAVPIEGTEALIGVGYGNEAAEVGRCLRAGLRESPLVPHAQTLTLMRQMEDLLAQVGVTYP
ncbi:Gfo/Idh/MocA family oxidoreductase [Nocardioides dongxiaopingii]|uniref:Gfo/Idh/MocA family protein n=1 Tax=Nocardioides sp. S-1144 TaxID=2582905 RepID=UPI00110E5C3F|nr:Gfo/Idh/MocA family oxidoreductase [Nocardioides sp. S-1144]QCW51781.1 Gfo/Idh/MocA family oxidoreductase [Nocardioides sp. S-1144]